MHRISTFRPTAVSLSTAFADQSADEAETEELVIPEDLSTLSDEELVELRGRAVEAFNALYQNGEASLATEDLEALQGLTEGIETLSAEVGTREAAVAERSAAAAELAARIGGNDSADGDEGDEEAEEEEAEEDSDEEEDEPVEELAEETVTASGRKETRINLGRLQKRRPATRRKAAGPQISDFITAAPDLPGYKSDTPLTPLQLGQAVDQRLTSFNRKAFEGRAAKGHIRQRMGVASIHKNIPDHLRITDDSVAHVDEVLTRAADESRLQGGSLVASGGWGAPHQVVYDLWEGESRDGIFTLPEVAITRGGARWPVPITFADLYSQFAAFSYTEQDDIDGDYDGDGGGEKPSYHIESPDFTEGRMDFDGLMITAGLLMRRGFPEWIARIIRGALVAHDHRMAGRLLANIEGQSDAITMPADQVGTLAPLLDAIEMHAEHTRELHRLPRGASIEGVFDYWVRGAIRSDLARRLGVDLIDVPDNRIDAWFRSRGIAPQFVWNFHGIAGTAKESLTQWPSTATFLMYPAGTWVKGGTDIITLDTIYDSVLLKQNDYVALFTEEGQMLMKRGVDSRAVTVPICSTGMTGGGLEIACDGTAAGGAGN